MRYCTETEVQKELRELRERHAVPDESDVLSLSHTQRHDHYELAECHECSPTQIYPYSRAE
jgi:hypothetical protein